MQIIINYPKQSQGRSLWLVSPCNSQHTDFTPATRGHWPVSVTMVYKGWYHLHCNENVWSFSNNTGKHWSQQRILQNSVTNLCVTDTFPCTNWSLTDRCDSHHCSKDPLIASLCSVLCNSIVLYCELNVALRSSRTSITMSALSKAIRRSFVTFTVFAVWHILFQESLKYKVS